MKRHEKALKILSHGTVIPATPLALDRERKLNEKGLRLLMNYYLDSGVGGIATAVHTTQFEIRKPEIGLFEPVLKIVSDEIDRYEARSGKVIVKIAGACGPAEQAVTEATLAKTYGYDAVLLSPGGLNHLSEEALLERTRAVAKVMPVIGFYLQTAVGGRVFSYDYWEKLCAIDNLVAIKCASFNRYQTLDVVRATALSERSENIALYTGNDDNIIIDLLSRYQFEQDGKTYEKAFCGGLLGHWSVWTRRAVELFDLTQAEKYKDHISPSLLTLASEVTDTNAAFFDAANAFSGCIAGVHEILRRQGLMENNFCLNPLETLSAGQAAEIERVYRMHPQLNDDDFVRTHLDEWKRRVGM
ncbi:MAG: dihydrodipicolinate synthase family protein [Clostridia bacterium]|nr:dihydrodipicolinate synthase family protein [Clostridia bacterium]